MDAATRDLVRRRAGQRCEYCQVRQELHKGPNLTGIDPETARIARLFDPRRDRWSEHFAFQGVRFAGLTEIGRATVHVLHLNDARRLELRVEILERNRLT